MIGQAYILHSDGRTLPVVALVKQNNVACVCVMEAPDKPVLIPLTKAVAAPGRTRPRLATINGEAV